MRNQVAIGLVIAAVLATAAFPSVVSYEGEPESGGKRMVDVGGYRLSCRVQGSGLQTVVFLSGFKAGQEYWGDIPRQVGVRALAVTYDRAGVGGSEESLLPYESGQGVEELRTLLRKLSVKPPYILVGHSFGCIYAHVFAARYPDLVAGLILLDPGHKDMLEGFSSLLAGDELERWETAWREVWARYEGRTDTLGQEMQAVDETLRLLHESRLDDDLRLVVVSALDPSRASPIVAGLSERSRRAYFAFLKDHHEAVAASTGRGRRVTAEGSGHMIPVEKPDFVAELVLEMLANASAAGTEE